MSYDKAQTKEYLRIAVANIQNAAKEIRYGVTKEEDLIQIMLENTATIILNIKARL